MAGDLDEELIVVSRRDEEELLHCEFQSARMSSFTGAVKVTPSIVAGIASIGLGNGLRELLVVRFL